MIENSNSLALEKQRLGLLYGLFAGLALTVTTWGMDAFLLWQAHAAFAWARFLIGGLASITAFGLAGWLTMRYEKGLLAALFWLIAAFIPANLAVWMIFDGWAFILSFLEPGLATRFTIPVYEYGPLSGLMMAIFSVGAVIAGILEIPSLGQTLLSSAAGGLVGPLLLAILASAAVGLIVDNALHVKLRESILNLDRTIQFVADNDLEKIDKATAREMRVAALKPVIDIVQKPRRLLIASFDQITEQVGIWVDFDGDWVFCYTVSNQVVNCKLEP